MEIVELCARCYEKEYAENHTVCNDCSLTPALVCHGKVLSYCNYDGMSVDLSISPDKQFAVTSAENIVMIHYVDGAIEYYEDFYGNVVIFNNHLLKLEIVGSSSDTIRTVVYEIYAISFPINLHLIDVGLIQVSQTWLYSNEMKQEIKKIAINTGIAKEGDVINGTW
jgi:hypothetical protein